MKIISGQFVPKDLPKRRDVIFLGDRPPKTAGNHNSSAGDFILHNWIRKYFKKAVYVTDMVKTVGRAGKRLREWDKNPRFRTILQKELKAMDPKIIVVMSRKAEEIFKAEPLFAKYKNRVRPIYPPYYVARWNKFSAWDIQFKKIINGLK